MPEYENINPVKIRLLSEQLAAKIAAGEVVERPVSVAKELIENSLDAGATRIFVEIKGGGVELVRIVDNGAGMDSGEVSLAFQRHATSKLSDVANLQNISTLGFRGEALPSIAAVSEVSLVTRTESSDSGWEIALKWGRLQRQGPRGCPPGTSTTVSSLFENVPARRKFLRSPAAEAGRIRELVSRYAMAYPEVGFHLTVEGREMLQVSGSGKAEEPLVSVYGAEVAKEALPVLWEDPSGAVQVNGFVGPPSLHRSTRRHITFFVNRRWVQSRMLSIALEESYHGLLPQGRRPISILNITVPYQDVDVNVHPTKAEVRFRHGDKVFSSVQRAVRGVLMGSSPVPQVQLNPTVDSPSFQPTFLSSSPVLTQQRREPSRQPADGGNSTVSAAALRVLGQAGSTYLVAEGPTGIFLLDQHAAHERVLYDKVIREMKLGRPSAQALLEPVTLELPAEHLELAKDSREELEAYGFILESFGGESYILRSVPSVFRDMDPAEGLLEVLQMVASPEGSSLGDRREALAASIACHSSVRAGMSLTQDEMREIIELLETTENPHTCPHGRPTMLHLSSQNLERQFGRR